MSDTTSQWVRHDIEIPRDGHTIAAWHYRPAADNAATQSLTTEAGAPAVVLGHGFAITRDCGLQSYAEHFASAGMHAVVFDYSGFGDSGGEPREVVSVKSELRDYQTVVDATRQLDGIDPDRIALWGTSYAGGLVIAAAARDGRIAAVVSQVPNLDNFATMRHLMARTSPIHLAWLTSAIAQDVARGILRRTPFHVQAMGPVGSHAAYVSDDGWEQVQQIAGGTWLNRVGLRDFATLPLFRAVSYLNKVPCRVLFLAAELDDLTPVAPTLAAAEKLGDRAELVRFSTGHFGIYTEPLASEAIGAQVRFLTSELTP